MLSVEFGDRFLGPELEAQMQLELERAHSFLEQIEDASCTGGEWTGWWNYPERNGFRMQTEIESYCRDLKVLYDLVLVIGIGGSYLGTRAIHEALKHSYSELVDSAKPQLVFLGHHLSEASMIETFDILERFQPIVNVISKSGTTTEPSVAFRLVRDYMEKRFGKKEAAQRIIATTDAKKGALRQVAMEEGYKSFAIPDDIGGRFSVFTPVGLVPLCLLGWDIASLMQGAHELFSELAKSSSQRKEHPVLKYAASRFSAYSQGKQVEILAFRNPKLFYLVEWWKQLFGESEGKESKGLLPVGMSYTSDLHSLGQYVQQGPRNLFETFLSFNSEVPASGISAVERRMRVPQGSDNLDQLDYLVGREIETINAAASLGTQIAHKDGGVASVSIQVGRLNEHGLGSLLAFFEVACGVSALMLEVNPFDQPGVEAYKKNLFGLLGKPGFEEIGEQIRRELTE